MSSPSKTSGKYHSVKGNIKKSVGSLFGNHSMTQRGREDHAAGVAESKAAQAKGYVNGTSDHMAGKADAVAGAATCDRSLQNHGSMRHDKGALSQSIHKHI